MWIRHLVSEGCTPPHPDPVTTHEVHKAIHQLNCKKAGDSQGISAEHLLLAGPSIYQPLAPPSRAEGSHPGVARRPRGPRGGRSYSLEGFQPQIPPKYLSTKAPPPSPKRAAQACNPVKNMATSIAMQFWHDPENNIPSKRTLKDSKSNKYGERLLLLCKNRDLLIANGRCGVDKSVGHTEISG